MWRTWTSKMMNSSSPAGRRRTTSLALALVALLMACEAAGAQLHHNNKQLMDDLSVALNGASKMQPNGRHLSSQASRRQQQTVDDVDDFLSLEQQLPSEAADYDVADADRFSSSGDEVDNPQLPEPGSYIASNCSSCVRRDELRRRNLEVIKDQILSKLGLQRAPNMTGRLPPRIPPLERLLDLYGMQADAPGGHGGNGFQPGAVYDEEEDDFHARTEKVISFAQHLPQVRSALKRSESPATRGMESIYFKFSDKVTRSSKVDRAHLWIYLQHQPQPHGHYSQHHRHHQPAFRGHNDTVWVHTYKVVRVPEGESPVLSPVRKTRVAMPAFDEKSGRVQTGGWVSIDVGKVVAEWFRYPEENLGFAVQVYIGDSPLSPASKSAALPIIVNDASIADGSLMSFVEVVTVDGRKQRTKRTIGLNCDATSSETRCCRYPLTVDFVEFGWDWIIAPKKYEANYCSGECPYVFLQKYPHTHIVQQANPGGTAGPCCAPRKMSSISMLYFDNDFNIIHGNLPGMVVDRCGCS